ncbi:hypothetical protein HW132_05055 [Brasilonema sp. CT11]|nr:hypothetical protein [Brasilonema sp. CT11]
MTQSVTDKTPIPENSWRRHSDPPGLWIAVATISFTLHLLLFWLLRSYSYNLLSQRNSSNPIPVEFVEISSQPKASSNVKPVLSTKPSTTQKSSVTSSPKLSTQGNVTPKSTSTIEDSNAFAEGEALPIALANPTSPKTSQPQVKDKTQQPLKKRVIKQEQPNPEPIATSQPTRQPEPFIANTPELPPQPTPEDTPQAQQPQPTPEPTTLADNSDTQNQPLQNQTPNPQNNTTDSTRPDSSPETGEQPKPLPKQPDQQVTYGKETPLPDLAPPVKPEQSPPDEQKGGGGALATWEIDTDAVKKDKQDNPPQIPADFKEKELDSLPLNTELSEQPVEFKALLIIDSGGNLNSIFLDPKQKIPEPQATQYKEYAEKIFKGQKFIPASSNNGNKPDLGQLIVNIKIQRKSPKS